MRMAPRSPLGCSTSLPRDARSMERPLRVAPNPLRAWYSVPDCGSSIQQALVCPLSSRPTMMAKGPSPLTKLLVPSKGSTSHTSPSSSPRNSSGLAAAASSPTTREPGRSDCKTGVRMASASRSASVTTSPGDFSMISCALSRRYLGRIAVCAAWRMAAATGSTKVLVATLIPAQGASICRSSTPAIPCAPAP